MDAAAENHQTETLDKPTTWRKWILLDEKNDLKNKNAKEVIKITKAQTAASQCIENIRKERDNGTMLMYKDPVSKTIRIVHQATIIGGTSLDPEMILCAISGLEREPCTVQLDLNMLNPNKALEKRVPTWNTMKSLNKDEDYTRTQTSNTKLNFSPIQAVTPLVASLLILMTPKQKGPPPRHSWKDL